MNKYLLIVSFGFVFQELSFSQTVINRDSLQLYHPLHQGNIWIYRFVYKNAMGADTSYKIEKVMFDTLITTNRYAAIGVLTSIYPTYIEPIEIKRFDRFDTTTTNFYSYFVEYGEYLYDITMAGVGNYSWGNVSIINIDGLTVPVRNVSRASASSASGAAYAWGLGLYSNWSWGSGITTEHILLYANINGKVFGKYPLDVIESNKTLDQTFQLSQNYPNPFNSQTTIEYVINKSNTVSLILYDILGREVMHIMLGDKSTGSHRETINLEHFASGVYYYRLIAGNASLIKKITYVK